MSTSTRLRMSTKLNTLTKVAAEFSVFRYDNGWMVGFTGEDQNGDPMRVQLVCLEMDELLDLVREYNALPLMGQPAHVLTDL
jgi:hypothetical protein